MARHDDETVDDARGPSRPADAAPAPTRIGILVIDDNELILTMLGTGLGAAGFSAWLARGGREGVALYRTHRARIDAVLLDVCMPDWDGPETLAALRALDPAVPCCFMSGHTGRYTETDLLARGAGAFIQKPFRLGAVIDLLRLLAPSPRRPPPAP